MWKTLAESNPVYYFCRFAIEGLYNGQQVAGLPQRGDHHIKDPLASGWHVEGTINLYRCSD